MSTVRAMRVDELLATVTPAYYDSWAGPNRKGADGSQGCGRFGGRFEGVWSCPETATGAELAHAIIGRLNALGLSGELAKWAPWEDEP